jgi:pyruvate,water dikinase
MARVTRAMLAVTGNMGAAPPDGGEANRLTGIAASPGRHEGTARIVHSVDDLTRVEPGDVIVAITTAEAFNLAMSFAAAVVTDQGGLLGHAAITSREYGIPAVVGTHRATTAIADGTRVVVDGTTGEVTW